MWRDGRLHGDGCWRVRAGELIHFSRPSEEANMASAIKVTPRFSLLKEAANFKRFSEALLFSSQLKNLAALTFSARVCLRFPIRVPPLPLRICGSPLLPCPPADT